MAPENEAPDDRELDRRAFAEDFGVFWEGAGSPRMEGRILGYLLIMQQPFISSSELAHVLNASAGSVSMTTRRLVEAGFVRRHAVAGDRSHYFRMERDVWGGWLAGERKFLEKQRALMERGLELLPETDEGARERLINGRDYMTWVISYHRKMLVDWEAAKAERDAGRTT
jgi:DNA-binding transcriptional regulator GbsR (MarR family)